MIIISHMAQDDMNKTKAYLAYSTPKHSERDPADPDYKEFAPHPNRLLMHMMWHSKKALDNSPNINHTLFGPQKVNLRAEISRNKELHASLYCIEKMLLDSSDKAVQADLQFLTKDKSRMLSPAGYAAELDERYPDLGNFFTHRLNAHSLRVKFARDAAQQTQIATAPEEIKPPETSLEIFSENKTTGGYKSFTEQMDPEKLKELYAKDSNYGNN